MHRIGVIGDKDSIFAFKAAGISVYPVTEEKEAENILHRLAGEGYAVIYIMEQFAKNILGAMEKYCACKYPADIPIPGNYGSQGLGRKILKKSVEKAVGADILFRDG